MTPFARPSSYFTNALFHDISPVTDKLYETNSQLFAQEGEDSFIDVVYLPQPNKPIMVQSHDWTYETIHNAEELRFCSEVRIPNSASYLEAKIL